METCCVHLVRHATSNFTRMPKFLDKFADQMMLWSLRHDDKGISFDGIGLVDYRGHGNSFFDTLQCSLRLIQEQDPRRYARVRKHILWIVNQVNSELGAQYLFSIRTCLLLFEDIQDLPRDFNIAFWAAGLVHEATHGVIESRGIKMTDGNWVQIERLCTTEQNRFTAKLSARDPARYPPELLQFTFDKQYWSPEYSKSRAERSWSFTKRLFTDRRTGPKPD